MKKIVIILVVVAVLIGGSFAAMKLFNVSLSSLIGQKQETEVMDQEVPETPGPEDEFGIQETSQIMEQSIFLEITSPADKSTVTTSTITLRGKTVPKAEIAINEQDIIADANGNFTAQVALEEGENPIIVVASDADGKATEKEITIMYEIVEK